MQLYIFPDHLDVEIPSNSDNEIWAKIRFHLKSDEAKT